MSLPAAVVLIASLSACQMAGPEVADLPPTASDQVLSAEGAWDASENTPSEFSDATGSYGM